MSKGERPVGKEQWHCVLTLPDPSGEGGGDGQNHELCVSPKPEWASVPLHPALHALL